MTINPAIPDAAWPTAELDPVMRMRVLAAGLPHVGLAEAVFETSIDSLWGLVGDLVDGGPQFELAVQSARMISRDGERLELEARNPLGFRMRFDVILRFGFCLMQSHHGLVGMAAREEAPGRTRFAHFEGATGLAGPILRPYFSWNVRGDMKRIARILACDFTLD